MPVAVLEWWLARDVRVSRLETREWNDWLLEDCCSGCRGGAVWCIRLLSLVDPTTISALSSQLSAHSVRRTAQSPLISLTRAHPNTSHHLNSLSIAGDLLVVSGISVIASFASLVSIYC